MDYYNFSPNFADSLNLFRPSTQRALGDECLSHTDNSQWVRYCPSKYRSQNHRTSSTSLIFQKTEVCQQSSESKNYRTPSSVKSALLQQEDSSRRRPLVQITVIPNSTSKKRKCKPSSKKLHNTVSNQQSSINSRNVYFVVTGKKRQKVYKVKTTGSAEISSSNQTHHSRNEESAVKRNLNQILNSLNMDKKKKKVKTREQDDEEGRMSLATMVANGGDLLCMCPDELVVQPCKSRLRITGKLGLTGDDKYVLKCAATIDDKPVETQPLRESRYGGSSPPCVECQDYNGTRKRFSGLREANVQANVREEPYNYCQVRNCPGLMGNLQNYRSVETQCTPANFSSVCFSNIETLRISSNRDQVVQCTCPSNVMNSGSQYNNEYYGPLRSADTPIGGSPLVIISVYQKKDSGTTSPDRTSTKDEGCSSPAEGSVIKSRKGKGGKKADNGDRTVRSRSPSPAKGRGGQKGDKKGKDKAKPAKAGESNKQSNKKNPHIEKSTNTDGSLNPTSKQVNFGTKVQNFNAIVNKRPKNGVSVKKGPSTTDLDNDKSQRSISTNLSVRVSMKRKTPQELDTDSLENFFLPTEEGVPRRRSYSQSFVFHNQQNAEVELAPSGPMPRLEVRDSIDVSHRREEKSLESREDSSSSYTNSPFEERITHAPNKHFQGDDCCISNPVERDKEIRQLLGIYKKKSQKPPEESTSNTGDTSLFDFYRTKRNSKFTIENHKSYPTISDTSSTLYFQDASVQKYESSELTMLRTIPPEVEWIYKRVQSPYDFKTVENRDRNKGPLEDMVILDPHISKETMYRQIMSHRNINMCLKMSRRKPIVLSRKQYAKLKRTIENNTLKKARFIDSFYKRRTICYTVRDVKLKRNQEMPKFKDDTCKQSHEEHEQKNTKEIGKNTKEIEKNTKEMVKHTKEIVPNKNNDNMDTPRKGKHETLKNSVINDVLKDEKCKKMQTRKQKEVAKIRRDRDLFTDTILNIDDTKIEHKVKCETINTSIINDAVKGQKHEKMQTLKQKEITKIRRERDLLKDTILNFDDTKVEHKVKRETINTSIINDAVKDQKHEKMQTLKQKEIAKIWRARDLLTDTMVNFDEAKVPNNKQPTTFNVCGHQRNISRENMPTDDCYYCQISKQRRPEVITIREHSTSCTRHSASSTELHYSSLTYMRKVTFSATNVPRDRRHATAKPSYPATSAAPPEPPPDFALNNYCSNSLHTIFKGHRNPPTPNLGTSGYSLFSESAKSNGEDLIELPPRKPFLKRLMSCLVMRSKISGTKINTQKPRLPSGDSTMDTYHISSSLGAIELSSSIYDTSTSFYTNHSIRPIGSKTKRGFLTSVKEYLTNRK